mgnify:CR=1 FL=1
MSLIDVAMVAADTTRTKYYIEELIDNKLLPSYILLLLNSDEDLLPGQKESKFGSEIITLLECSEIEFDIAITTYSFDIDYKIKNLVGDAITDPEKKILKKTFLDHTKELLSEESQGSISQALKGIDILAKKQKIQKKFEEH